MIGQMTVMAARPALNLLQNVPINPNQFTPEQQLEFLKAAVHDPSSGPTGYLVPLAFFAMIVLIVWLVTRRKQAQYRAQAEIRKQLIDKFGSAQELATFMESKGGQQFFGDMQGRAKGPLRFLPGGVVVSMLGLAFLGLTLMRRNFIIPAVILFAVGAGLLISAAIAHKLESKKDDETINPGTGVQHFPSA